MESLCNILEQELESTQDHKSITYEIIGTEESLETSFVKEFLKYDIPNDWQRIRLNLYSNNKKIHVYIDKKYDSTIDIESNDYNWLHGKKNQIKKNIKAQSNRSLRLLFYKIPSNNKDSLLLKLLNHTKI